MSRTELVKRSGISKQQLSRLENGLIRLRLDHLKPFAPHVGYTPEQMLLWGRYPGTGDSEKEAAIARRKEFESEPVRSVPELDNDAETTGRGRGKDVRKIGRHSFPIKLERWGIPPSFVREQLHASAELLIVIETLGDSMAPVIMSGERVIVDTPTPPQRPTGSTPSGIPLNASTLSGCNYYAQPTRRGLRLSRLIQIMRPRKFRLANWKSSARSFAVLSSSDPDSPRLRRSAVTPEIVNLALLDRAAAIAAAVKGILGDLGDAVF